MPLGRQSGDIGRNHSLPRSLQSKAETLDATVANLNDLDAAQLCLQWRNHLGGTAPAHLPRWLLLRVLAYRVQAATRGDLDKATERSIRASRGDAMDFVGSPFKKRKPRTREGMASRRERWSSATGKANRKRWWCSTKVSLGTVGPLAAFPRSRRPSLAQAGTVIAFSA